MPKQHFISLFVLATASLLSISMVHFPWCWGWTQKFMQAEATLVWSYMAGPLESHVCVLKWLVYLIQHYILKIHLYCSKLFSVSVSPPTPVWIHACGRGCAYVMCPSLRGPKASAVLSIVTPHLILWDKISHWPRGSSTWLDWLSSKLCGASCLCLDSMRITGTWLDFDNDKTSWAHTRVEMPSNSSPRILRSGWPSDYSFLEEVHAPYDFRFPSSSMEVPNEISSGKAVRFHIKLTQVQLWVSSSSWRLTQGNQQTWALALQFKPEAIWTHTHGVRNGTISQEVPTRNQAEIKWHFPTAPAPGKDSCRWKGHTGLCQAGCLPWSWHQSSHPGRAIASPCLRFLVSRQRGEEWCHSVGKQRRGHRPDTHSLSKTPSPASQQH